MHVEIRAQLPRSRLFFRLRLLFGFVLLIVLVFFIRVARTRRRVHRRYTFLRRFSPIRQRILRPFVHASFAVQSVVLFRHSHPRWFFFPRRRRRRRFLFRQRRLHPTPSSLLLFFSFVRFLFVSFDDGRDDRGDFVFRVKREFWFDLMFCLRLGGGRLDRVVFVVVIQIFGRGDIVRFFPDAFSEQRLSFSQKRRQKIVVVRRRRRPRARQYRRHRGDTEDTRDDDFGRHTHHPSR